MAENILELKNVVFSFRTYGGNVKAVRDVSFNVRQGEILGIVGESGPAILSPVTWCKSLHI